VIGDVVVLALLYFAVAYLFERRARRRLPTYVAKQRLETQLSELRRDLAAVTAVDPSYIAAQEERIRQEWIRERLVSTPIEDLDIPGTGPATHKALRASGIATVDDIGKLGTYGVKVPSIGLKKEEQLLGAFRNARRRVEEDARRLGRADLDTFSHGRLSAAIARHEAEELQRRRQEEGIRVRIREIERRRAALA
jgi:DNA-binding helix-hairpin-helix protein with protein kinase domain